MPETNKPARLPIRNFSQAKTVRKTVLICPSQTVAFCKYLILMARHSE
jgi:hypothetical protein